MRSAQRLIGIRPDGVIRTDEHTTASLAKAGRITLPKWLLYWGERIPGQEVDEILLAGPEHSFYQRMREPEGRRFTPVMIELQPLTPEEFEYFTKVAEEYEPG